MHGQISVVWEETTGGEPQPEDASLHTPSPLLPHVPILPLYFPLSSCSNVPLRVLPTSRKGSWAAS